VVRDEPLAVNPLVCVGETRLRGGAVVEGEGVDTSVGGLRAWGRVAHTAAFKTTKAAARSQGSISPQATVPSSSQQQLAAGQGLESTGSSAAPAAPRSPCGGPASAHSPR
jgi:hypothetical protein